MTPRTTPNLPAEFERACRISRERKFWVSGHQYYGKLHVPGEDTATCEQEFA